MRRPWGEDRSTSLLGQGLSRDRAVLVDEPTEHVVALDLGPGRSVGGGSTGGHAEVKTAMRPLLVVVAEVLPQDGFEVAPPEHQGPVEAIDASGPHGPLGERVRPGRAHRGLDHFGTFRPEDLVEKLAVNFVSRSRTRNLT